MIEHSHTWHTYETHLGDYVVYLKERCTDTACDAIRNRHMKRSEYDAALRAAYEQTPLVQAIRTALESLPNVHRIDYQQHGPGGFHSGAATFTVWYAPNAFVQVAISEPSVVSVVVEPTPAESPSPASGLR